MGGSYFELIMQEVQQQKQRMDELSAENRELRRQLAELRNGHGIFLNIEGILFALNNDDITNQYTAVLMEPVGSMAVTAPMTQSTPVIFEPTPVTLLATDSMGTIPETPHPSTDEFMQIPQFVDELEVEEGEVPPGYASTFLEDMLVDEFAAAATSPMAVWKAPAPVTRKLTAVDIDDEAQKAALRKELIGSFLLE